MSTDAYATFPTAAAEDPPAFTRPGRDGPTPSGEALHPDSSWTWYVLEWDGNDLCFGLVIGHEEDWVLLAYGNREARGPLGLPRRARSVPSAASSRSEGRRH